MDLFLLLLMFSPISVFSQIVQQSGPGLVRPSQQLKVTCTVSGFELTSYGIQLSRQAPGKGLEWIGGIWSNGGTAYTDSLKSRTTITRDTSKKQVYLQMNNMETADTGMYYCARGLYSGSYFDIWGPGTLVTVTTDEIITPHVFPMIAVKQTDIPFTSFGCLVSQYFPPPVSVIWSTATGETVSGNKDFPTFLTGQPPAYSLFSQVTVNNNEWNSNTYQCNVSHQSTSIQKIIPKGCSSIEPSVHLLQGTCPESNNGEIELTCQVYNLTSQDATLKWYINDKERSFPKDEVELGKSQDNLFALLSTVTISQAEWNNGVPVKCHVTDPKTEKTAEGTIKKCSDSFNCLGLNVFMVQPSIEDLYVHKTARIACVASNLKDTNEKYSFEWSFPGASDELNIQTEDPQLQENGTYSVSSVLNISPDVWLQQTEFTCIFRHSGLQTPIITRIRKDTETKMSKPMVSVFPPSADEIEMKETYTLICLVYKFNPKDSYVGWTANDMEVSKELYVNTEPKLETSGNTYFMFSKLTILPSDWDSGTRYVCVVGHETVPMNFISRSMDKFSGKPTKVNVSLKMSDTTLSCF